MITPLMPGKYVVAVSGGLDSMVLLDILRCYAGLKLTVAHFDHGIRPDSQQDRLLVQRRAEEYSLPFVYDEGNLGDTASEATARTARYKFLETVRQASDATALITAHHQDDVLETAILNLVRGTGRRGLTSLRQTDSIKRPLLHLSKEALRSYADEHQLTWREDSTNQDVAYARNYVRHTVLSRLDDVAREKLLAVIANLSVTNQELDKLLINQLRVQPKPGTIDRQWFALLPHTVAKEVLMAFLRQHDIRNFDKKTIERAVVAAKTYKVGKQLDIINGVALIIGKDTLALRALER